MLTSRLLSLAFLLANHSHHAPLLPPFSKTFLRTSRKPLLTSLFVFTLFTLISISRTWKLTRSSALMLSVADNLPFTTIHGCKARSNRRVYLWTQVGDRQRSECVRASSRIDYWNSQSYCRSRTSNGTSPNTTYQTYPLTLKYYRFGQLHLVAI